MSIISPPDSPPSGDVPESPPVPQEAVEVATQNGSSSIKTAGGYTDERRGLPSASSFPRYSYCPASFALEWQLREMGQLPIDHGSSDADRGTRTHEALAKLATGADAPMAGLTPSEQDTAESLWDRAQSLLSRTFGSVDDIEVIVEERQWLTDTNGNLIASGKFDLMAYNDRLGLVTDYKTLFGEHDPAPINMQLRFGAVMLAESHGVREIEVGLIQHMRPNSTARMDSIDIEESLEEIDTILGRRHKDPFSLGFRKGPKCTYCPARLACPALQWDLAQIQSSPLAVIAGATDEQLGRFLNACKSVEHLDKAATKEAEARIKSGRAVPGWKLEASPGKRQVNDARTLANRLIARGAKLDDVLSAMTINVGNAERIHKSSSGLKGKAATDAFNEIAEGTIEKSSPEPTLKRA